MVKYIKNPIIPNNKKNGNDDNKFFSISFLLLNIIVIINAIDNINKQYPANNAPKETFPFVKKAITKAITHANINDLYICGK
jgi:preprotein translocase subunit SecB